MSTLAFYQGLLNNPSYPFPSDDIDPKDKDKPDYSLAWCQAILWNYFQDNCGIQYSEIPRYERIRSYMRGRQSPEIYKDMLLGKKGHGTVGKTMDIRKEGKGVVKDPNNPHYFEPDYRNEDRIAWADINFEDIYTPAPRIMNRLLGLLEKTENDVSVEALDEKSAILKKKKKEGIWFDKKFKPQRDAIQKGLGLQPHDEALPEDREELDLYEDLGGTKLPYETAMEKALGHTFDISDHSQNARKLKRDLIEIGTACTMDEVNIEEQKVYEKYLEPEDLIIEYSSKDDFTKSRYGAYPLWMTVTEVKEETGMDDEELLRFASTLGGMYGNPSWNANFRNRGTNGEWLFGDWRVPVLYAAWITVNQKWDVERQTKEGKKVYEGKFGKFYDGREGSKKTVITNVEVIYHCKWIVNSEIIWNYGIMNDIVRDEKGCVRLPFHVYKILGKSIGEQLMIPLDDIQLAHLVYQNGKAKAPPAGVAVDIDALENLTFGGKQVDLKEWVRLYWQTGIGLYKGSKAGMPPGTTPARPFEILQGGSAVVIKEFADSVSIALNSIGNITGLDPVSLANDNTKTPVKIAELGVEDMNDTLVPIYSAYVAIKESFSRNSASRIQLICMFNTDDSKGYFSVIGEDGVKAIAEAKNRKAAYYGISIHDKPKQAEKQNFLQTLGEAMKPGKSGTAILKPSQYSFLVSQINSAGGLKTAQKMLAYWETKKEQRDVMIAEMNSQKNTERMAAIEMGKDQAKIKLEEAKTNNKIKELVVQHILDTAKGVKLSQKDFEEELAMFGVNTLAQNQQQTPQQQPQGQQPQQVQQQPQNPMV